MKTGVLWITTDEGVMMEEGQRGRGLKGRGGRVRGLTKDDGRCGCKCFTCMEGRFDMLVAGRFDEESRG